MKTLLFTLGLLLLVTCCTNAMPNALFQSTAPGSCCFHFSSLALPKNRVIDITRTHRSCLNRGFIVQTILKKKMCFSQNFRWAQTLYKEYHSDMGIASN